MLRKAIHSLLTLALVAAAALPAQAQSYKAGSTPTGVPFTFLDTKTNTIQGAVVDLAQAVAKDQNLSIEIQGMPFATLIPSLTSGKIDIIAAALGMTPARKEVVDFTSPVYAYGEGLIVKADDARPYTSAKDLQGEVIGVQVGTVYEEPMRKTGYFKEIKVYDSMADAIRDVGLGRIKAAFGDYPIVAYQIAQGVHQGVRMAKTYKPIVNVEIGMAVRKGDKATLQKLDTALAHLKSNGTLDQILAKWSLK